MYGAQAPDNMGNIGMSADEWETLLAVGLTIYDRCDWADSTDQAFMDMRHQELLDRLATPQKDWYCHDSGEKE